MSNTLTYVAVLPFAAKKKGYNTDTSCLLRINGVESCPTVTRDTQTGDSSNLFFCQKIQIPPPPFYFVSASVNAFSPPPYLDHS